MYGIVGRMFGSGRNVGSKSRGVGKIVVDIISCWDLWN